MMTMMMMFLFFVAVSMLLLSGVQADNDNSNSNNNNSNNSSEGKQLVSAVDRDRQNRNHARRTLRLGASDACHFTAPLNIIQGKLCGAYYKVLGMDRFLGPLDRVALKRAHRQQSLLLHPDRNNAVEATAAFTLVTTAYNCLSDDVCAADYESRLQREESRIQESRTQLRNHAIDSSLSFVAQLHRLVSVAAAQWLSVSADVWELLGELRLQLLGSSHRVAQYALVATLALTKLRLLLLVQAAAFLVTKINYELAKSHVDF